MGSMPWASALRLGSSWVSHASGLVVPATLVQEDASRRAVATGQAEMVIISRRWRVVAGAAGTCSQSRGAPSSRGVPNGAVSELLPSWHKVEQRN